MTPGSKHLILLDSGPLGAVTHPRGNVDTLACKAWLKQTLIAGHKVLVPEICYYEVRRELRRTELRESVPSRGLSNLEKFSTDAEIISITSNTIRLASDLWAQALLLKPEEWEASGFEVVIATGNVGHLSLFAPAKHWRDVR